MYHFVDRPLAQAPEGCRMLAWSMRKWVAAAAQRECPAQALASPFAQLNLLSGLQPFLRVMALLNRHGLDKLRFCNPRCKKVGEDEAVILGIACLLAESRPVEAQACMTMLVEENAVGGLFEAFDALVRAMAAAGLAPALPLAPAPRD